MPPLYCKSTVRPAVRRSSNLPGFRPVMRTPPRFLSKVQEWDEVLACGKLSWHSGNFQNMRWSAPKIPKDKRYWQKCLFVQKQVHVFGSLRIETYAYDTIQICPDSAYISLWGATNLKSRKYCDLKSKNPLKQVHDHLVELQPGCKDLFSMHANSLGFRLFIEVMTCLRPLLPLIT